MFVFISFTLTFKSPTFTSHVQIFIIQKKIEKKKKKNECFKAKFEPSRLDF